MNLFDTPNNTVITRNEMTKQSPKQGDRVDRPFDSLAITNRVFL
jgi:hypothetical protein